MEKVNENKGLEGVSATPPRSSLQILGEDASGFSAAIADARREGFNEGVIAAKNVLGNCFAGTKTTKPLRFAIDKAASYGNANTYVHRWYQSTSKELTALLKPVRNS